MRSLAFPTAARMESLISSDMAEPEPEASEEELFSSSSKSRIDSSNLKTSFSINWKGSRKWKMILGQMAKRTKRSRGQKVQKRSKAVLWLASVMTDTGFIPCSYNIGSALTS